MVSKRFLKKKDNKKSSSKNSIKVTNKQQNKLNKSKKRKGEENKLKKALKQANKVLIQYFKLKPFLRSFFQNLLLKIKDGRANNQENENSDDEQLRKDNTYFSHVNNKHISPNNSNNGDPSGRVNKRKNLSNESENSFEAKYKARESINRNGMMSNGKKTIHLALPIKTQSGHLVKNVREEEEDDDEKLNEKKVKYIVEEAKPEEKPKSFVEQLKEKQDNFNRTKEKVAYFSRDIIENPQREVY